MQNRIERERKKKKENYLHRELDAEKRLAYPGFRYRAARTSGRTSFPVQFSFFSMPVLVLSPSLERPRYSACGDALTVMIAETLGGDPAVTIK